MRAGRKSTGKRLRFEIFKRDAFACRYCGRQPPAVVLVVDHVLPVAAGGSSAVDNLVTSCEACNQGKAGNVLDDVALPLNAHEALRGAIMELTRRQNAVAQREAAATEAILELREARAALSGKRWYSLDEVFSGMADLPPSG